MKSLKIAVLVKQVIDTYSAGGTTLNSDGTINRDQLPAIINPDDLNALGLAFKLRDMAGGGTVTVISMGPPRAVESIREAIWRGADKGLLLSDRKFAGSDTLATSYALSQAIRMIKADIVLCGSQSIDGDTGHVGPQTAQQLGIPQVTYTEDIIKLSESDGCLSIQAIRLTDAGNEIVEVSDPVLFTVARSASSCGPKNVRRMMEFKNKGVDCITAADLDADIERLGLTGSPTRVVDSVKFTVEERNNSMLTSSESDIESMFAALRKNNLID
jgi:electron transfer flavoprotein beta subunit